jgi:hypothetical protein
MIAIDASQADAAVHGYLLGLGGGPVTLAEICAGTGLPRITARTSMYALNHRGAICMMQDIGDYGTTSYVIRHLHPDAPEESTDGPVPS